MAMLQMQRISIYAVKKDRKPILEMLQRRGVIEINDVIPEDDVFRKMDVSHALSVFEKNIHSANEAVEIIKRYVPLKTPSSLKGRKTVTPDGYDAFRLKYEQTVHQANCIIGSAREITELKAEILKLQTQLEMLTPWMNLDIPMSFNKTAHTKGYLGTFPKEWSIEALYTELNEYMPVHIELIHSTKEQTCIFVLCLKDMADGVFEKLRTLDFCLPSFNSDKAPVQQKAELEKQIYDAEAAIITAQEAIEAKAQYLEDLLFLQDYEKMRLEKYEVLGQISQSQNIFVVTGYIPKREVQALETALRKYYTVAIDTEEPDKDEDTPVLLQNNAFARPLEWVVESFSLPGKGEMDPTMVMAVFYYLLFGIIMADGGYGTLVAGACGFLLLKYGKHMEAFMKNFITMFLYCGISTIFWGVMFGSYFGDLFDVIATTFFGVTKIPLIDPLWFVPMNKPMKMLTFSMGLGIIHLLTGLIMKTYQLIRQKDYIAILYDAVSWFTLVVSCTLILLSLDMIKSILGINPVIPDIVRKASSITAIIASLIIIATNGRESRNPLKRFLKGLYALYGISGYLSDVLSYSRLLALGLASGVICSVVNKMAAMASNNPIGPFAFIIIVLFGHTLNFAINILGAYVHTNRLQYVEFFGKFYGGGGRSFHPFTMRTKYYKVKENMKNEYE